MVQPHCSSLPLGVQQGIAFVLAVPFLVDNERIENTCPNKNLQHSVLSSIIHNNRQVETTPVPMIRTDKQSVIRTHSGMLLVIDSDRSEPGSSWCGLRQGWH